MKCNDINKVIFIFIEKQFKILFCWNYISHIDSKVNDINRFIFSN